MQLDYHTPKARTRSKRVERAAAGVAIGALVTGVIVLVAFASAKSSRFTTQTLIVTFPIPTLLDSRFGLNGLAFTIGLALAQFPFYGFVIAWPRNNRGPVAAVVAICHSAAVLIAFAIYRF